MRSQQNRIELVTRRPTAPCQLLKDPHPQRLSVDDCLQHKSLKADILQVAPDWSPYLIDMASSDKDPIVYIDVPQVPGKTSRSSSRSDFLLV